MKFNISSFLYDYAKITITEENDMKKRCAKEALKYIKDESVIGLGGGSTIAYLIEYIKAAGLKVKVVTPSHQSEELCIREGLEIIPTRYVDHVDVAFDGCDEVDRQLNALKSGGGIHTREKIIGSMADEYILLVDESKVYDTLGFEHPVVVELVKDAYYSVKKQIESLGGKVEIRNASNKDGGIVSDQGLMLVDVMFNKVENIQKLHDDLLKIVGVLEISLFCNVPTKALIVKENGFEEIIKK